MPDAGFIPFPGLQNTRSVLPKERMLANVRANVKSAPEIVPLPPHDEKVAIVGGGPSLKKTLPLLRGFPGKVVAAGSSHDFLMKHHIRPWGAVALDPLPEMARYYLRPHRKTQYFLASICDPGLFRHLRRYKVSLWHPNINADLGVPANVLIGGGITVVLRSVHLLHALGFRRFHFFGFDGCDDIETGEHHAYDAPADPDQHTYRFAGRDFLISGGLVAQFDDFKVLIERPDRDYTLTVHGDGLMAEMLKQSKIG